MHNLDFVGVALENRHIGEGGTGGGGSTLGQCRRHLGWAHGRRQRGGEPPDIPVVGFDGQIDAVAVHGGFDLVEVDHALGVRGRLVHGRDEPLGFAFPAADSLTGIIIAGRRPNS